MAGHTKVDLHVELITDVMAHSVVSPYRKGIISGIEFEAGVRAHHGPPAHYSGRYAEVWIDGVMVGRKRYRKALAAARPEAK